MNWKDLLFKKKLLFHAISIALFALITLVYCSPILEGKRIKQSDIIQFQGMSKEIQDFRDETGDEALWTNSMYGGMPAYQISVKYPNNILLHIDKALQLGFPRPIGVMFLYFLGFYILMLSMKLDYKLAFLASIAFGLSSYFLIILGVGHNTKAHAISYMAPTIAGMLWCFRGKRLLGFFLTFLFLGLQIRANHPQISYYLMFVLFSFWLAYLIYSIKDKKIKFFISNTVVFVLGCFLAIMINIASLWSTYDYSKYTMRGGSDLIQEESGLKQDYAMEWSYGKMETFNLLIPNLYGGSSSKPIISQSKINSLYNPILENEYKNCELHAQTAISTWLSEDLKIDLKLYNILIEKYNTPNFTDTDSVQLNLITQKLPSETKIKEEMQSIYFDCTQEISLNQPKLSQYWGPQIYTEGPVYLGATVLFLFLLSLFFLFHDGQKIKILKLCLLGLCFIALLLAWGSNFQWFNNLFFNHFPLHNKFRTVSMILIIVQLVVPIIAIFGLNSFLKSDIEKKKKRNKVLLSGGVLIFICLMFVVFWDNLHSIYNNIPEKYGVFFDTIKNARFDLLESDVKRTIIFILLICTVLLSFCWSKLNKNWTIGIIVCLIIFDLWSVDKRYLNNTHFVTKFIVENPYSEPNNQDLKSDTTIFRVLDLDNFGGTNTSYFFHSIGGYHGAKLSKYQNLMDSVIIPFLQGKIYNDAGLAILNTKYLIKDKNVAEFGQSNLGNAWFVEDVDTVSSNIDELNYLSRLYFNPATTAIINTDQLSDFNNTATISLNDIKEFEYDSTATIRLIANKNNYNPSRLVYKTSDLKNTQLAVFSEIYYPKGWRVYIDGEEVDYFRVNYLLRGLMIPKGEHEIVFEFKPNSFYVGNKIALGSSIIFLITFFTVLVYYLKPELINNIYSRSEV